MPSFHRTARVAATFLLLTTASVATAEELSGLVRIVGNAYSSQVILTQPGAFNGPSLCPGDLTKRVRNLETMIVKTTGAWRDAQGTEKCFDVSDFTVLKTTTGHDVTIGTLSQKDGAYVLTTEDGKTFALTEVSDGLRKLAGKKIILDLKQQAVPGAKDLTYKTISYSEFP